MEYELKKKITDYLVQEYKCHSIVIYGSYVNGDYTDESDIDVVCFSDEPTIKSNDTCILSDKQLDAWMYKTEKMNDVEEFLRIKGGEILLDDRGICSSFLHDIDELFHKGPKRLTLEEKQFLQSWVQKMYRRALKGDIEGDFRYHWLLVDSLEMYFNIKGIWFLGPKKSLSWLYENERDTYILFHNALQVQSNMNDLKRLVDCIMRL